MLVVVHGSDSHAVRTKANERLLSLKKKRPNAHYFDVHGENVTERELEELVGGRGLFDDKYIIRVIEGFKGPNGQLFMSALEQIAASENGFVFIESSLTAMEEKKITVHAFRVYKENGNETRAVRKTPLVFTVTNAFAARDPLQTWVRFVHYLHSGESMQALIGALSSTVRKLLRCKKNACSGYDATNAKYFTEEELESFSRMLIDLYHKEKSIGTDLAVSLEKFILTFSKTAPRP